MDEEKTTPDNDAKQKGAELQARREKANLVNALSGAAAEILFIILPLLVLAIIYTSNGHAENILASPEWSFGTAVLFGQGVVRLVRALSEKGHAHGERAGLICTIILVLGLVPSLVVLSLILLNEPPPLGLVTVQCCLFVLSILAYVFCSGLASTILFDDEK